MINTASQHLERRQAWREFVVDRAHAGDDAISALRERRYRERRVEPELETADWACIISCDVRYRLKYFISRLTGG